ncbi:MAG: AmmeMemoRadiSam system protein B [Planctomycetes bacterium]|nr:AmmeMemoRadiSam system protein B [Planctomycetota bacterium]
MTRMPIVAGMFYEASAAACRQAATRLLQQVRLPDELPTRCVGGLVPHAGWVCSGAVAATTLKALTHQWGGQTILLFGAVHSRSRDQAMVYAQGAWHSPLGDVPIDAQLAEAILSTCDNVVSDANAHAGEHSIEVQLPFIQLLCPQAHIVPIMVPPSMLAVGIGRQIGEVLAGWDLPVLALGSTDLTHYGPRYGITPAGVGPAGLQWAHQNDQQLLKLIKSMAAEEVIDHTTRYHSACGGGAIAATIAACSSLGASAATVLWHTNSSETLRSLGSTDTDNCVGYASVVFS